MDKLQSQKAHAKRRAKERYNVDLSTKDLIAMSQMIQRGKSTFISRHSLRASKHRVEYKGAVYIVAYDTSRQSICSFLPPPTQSLQSN